jgi:hypothetical protein
MNEIECCKKNLGKWSQKNVPHKEWICVDIEDLGEPSKICEMCESQPIRYVHYMEHPDYTGILGVGCVCAGNMEDNRVDARMRDDFMKNRARKRLRWIANTRWKISQKGNDFIKTDGYIIVMKKQGALWSALVESEDETFKQWSYRKYETIEMAKLAAFDFLTKILADNEIKKQASHGYANGFVTKFNID